jgi:hypothetical protein
MSAVAASLINWSALGKIVLVALVGGGGVVIALGLVLLSVERAKAAAGRGRRIAHWGSAGACGMCCIAALAVAIYAMVEKPAAKPAPKSTPARIARTG